MLGIEAGAQGFGVRMSGIVQKRERQVVTLLV